jgi:glycosyltransferase involved in cell wall biosynthesis
LVCAFARLARERADALLVIAGTAPRAEIARAAAHAGIASRVRLAGFVDDIVAAYSAADLFVFPTLYDHWGLPIVEALACKTRVVASAAAGASQAIDDGRTGVLVHDARDDEAVAQAMAVGSTLAPVDDDFTAGVSRYAWPNVVDLVEKKLLAVVGRAR